jgi:hypothetical protein
MFLTFNDNGPSVSELGFRGEWLKRRVGDHVKARGKSGNIWEFGECQQQSSRTHGLMTCV